MVSSTFQTTPWFSGVWRFTGSAYEDNTLAAQRSSGAASPSLSDTNDFLYLGSESRFDLAAFTLDINGTIGTPKWEYYNGSAWKEFVPVHEYDFTTSGAEEFGRLADWAAVAFSNSAPHSATPPDTTSRFWVRVSSPTSVTTAPTISQIHMRPYAAYCRAEDVANLLQVASFDDTNDPTRQTVEDSIAAAQSYIDYYTQKSWRVNYQKDEFHEFNTAGFTLARKDAFKMISVDVWNGGEFETRTEGRDSDYFLVPDRNIIYWARYFILPARFASAASRLAWWGYGEFVLPVKVSYLYGRNIYTDEREGRLAFDIARKLAAIDIFTSHDYSVLVASGSDKVSMETKIREWKEDTDNNLESLKSWQVF